MDAIICRHGCVIDEGNGRIGWYLVAKSAKGINRWLPKLVAAGAIVKQEGDSEAAGDAPADRIGGVLQVLQPFKKQPQNPGSYGQEDVQAPESTQKGRRVSTTRVSSGACVNSQRGSRCGRGRLDDQLGETAS